MTNQEKRIIERCAQKARMGMSEWVLVQILPSKKEEFQRLLRALQRSLKKSYALAEIHDLFQTLSTIEFEQMVADPPRVRLELYWENYLAAMIEYAANQREIDPPSWIKEIKPLDHPVFGTDLQSLRLYLLTHTPLCFRNRNIFIGASVGGGYKQSDVKIIGNHGSIS